MTASRATAPRAEDPSAANRAKRPRSVFRHHAERALFRLGVGALAHLPGGTARALGRGAARLAFRLLGARRRILLANLTAAFPEKSEREIAAIARRSIENFGSALVDFLDLSRASREALLARVSIAGENHLRAARARGRGVLLLSAHFGSWEIGGIAAGLLGEPIALLVRPLDNPLLEEELDRRRTGFGNRTIPKKEAVRELLRAMGRNESVAILVDQNVVPREAVFVPFFGRPAATTFSLALLQLKTGAAVVPVFTWPEGGGRYRLEFERPILPEEFGGPAGDREERVRRATARYMEVTEAAIRRAPAAWLWMHDRWKTKPPDDSVRSSKSPVPRSP